MYIYIYAYIHTQTHTHTHIYIYMYIHTYQIAPLIHQHYNVIMKSFYIKLNLIVIIFLHVFNSENRKIKET
jgi:hypothetical protein